MPPRLEQAVTLLVQSDAAVVTALERNRPEPLSWSFDPRPGYERAHDRVLDPVLPLLLPRIVRDSLYPFQRQGVAWLLTHRRAILADDMGLGKTVQVLAALRRLFRVGKITSALVVVPRSLLSNWEHETQKWAPELVTRRYMDGRGKGGSTPAWASVVSGSHLLLTSYERVRSPSADICDHPPDIIVADEAHRLRKAESLAHKGLRCISASRFWALTGTPVENSTEDLSVLLSLLDPTAFSVDDHRHGTMSLRARARPFILRRTKRVIRPELPQPEKREEVVALTSAQRAAYRRELKQWNPGAAGAGLLLFNNLRRICDYEEATRTSSKLERAVEIIKAAADDGDKTVIFSYTIAPLRALLLRIRSELGDVGRLLIGEQPLEQRNRVVAYFKSDRRCVALLCSMRVGGEGLTLTEANHVILINRWWNPSTNDQAIDRVVRIGQTKPVVVHYLTCKDTIEDRLQPLLDRKKMTFVQLIDALQYQPDSVRELLT